MQARPRLRRVATTDMPDWHDVVPAFVASFS